MPVMSKFPAKWLPRIFDWSGTDVSYGLFHIGRKVFKLHLRYVVMALYAHGPSFTQ